MALFTQRKKLVVVMGIEQEADDSPVDRIVAAVAQHPATQNVGEIWADLVSPPRPWGEQLRGLLPRGRKRGSLGRALLVDKGTAAPAQVDANQLAKQRRGRGKQQLQRSIAISAVSMGLSALGMVYPVVGLLGGVGLVYNAFFIIRDTYYLLRQGKVTVDLLLTGTIIGCALSGHFFVGNFAALMQQAALLLLLRVTAETKSQLIDVFKKAPQFVWILADGIEVQIPFAQLEAGHVVVVQAGELIPADGTVIEGMATVDQHILTGEARPVERGVGETVFASTVVLAGRIHFQVEKAGQQTTVAQIGNILNRTTDFKSSVVLRSEDLANHTVIPTLCLSAVSLPFVGVMGALGIFDAHFKRRMTLITPISILNYFSIASKQGILIKDGRSLDLLHQVDTIVFDKTGTLTEEQPYVSAIHPCAHYSEDEVLQLASAAEHKQTHPIARAILAAAQQRHLELPTIVESEYKVGYGLTVVVDGRLVRVGSHRFMETVKIPLPPMIEAIQTHAHQQGHSLVMVAVDEALVGAIELRPTVRPEAKAVIAQLKQRANIKETYIISGDNDIPTRKLAQELGIDFYFAETLPEQKADLIAQLQQEGRYICYVGDGINDTIALKKAQVSISLKGASTMATDTAQILLLDQGLGHLNFLFDMAEDFYTSVNTIFGIVLIPTLVGIGGIYLLGFGLVQTVLLNTAGLVVGIGYAMTPRLKYRKQLSSSQGIGSRE